MPRNPGGGESPPGSIEAGLRDLAKYSGPDIRQLSRGDTESLRAIMQSAQTPGGWPREAKATAVLTVITELIHDLTNPRWKSAALAAFRLPTEQFAGAECDSLAGRWRALARTDGATDQEVRDRAEQYRGYWIIAANRLADQVERRLKTLNAMPSAWDAYRVGQSPALPESPPISFDRTDVLYRFRGHQGLQSISYRSLVAHVPIDHYDPVGWYYNDPNAPVEIVPLANCSLDGPLRDLPQGGKTATLRFSHTLDEGEHYFFAYMIVFNSQQPCRPTVLYDVRGREMSKLVVRAQFDPAALPYKCWYFDMGAQSEGSETPPDDSPVLLDVARNGYIEHLWENCQQGRKYGLQWSWSELAI